MLWFSLSRLEISAVGESYQQLVTFVGRVHQTTGPVEDEISYLKPGCLIIDVSCDEGMGFVFAKPTTFKTPMFKVGNVDYYAVDHTPSYLWESASWSISAALIVHLPTVLAGASHWQQNETIRQAVNIDAGVIQKPDIVSFQNREAFYPHAPVDMGRH